MALLILPGAGGEKGNSPPKLLSSAFPHYLLKAPMMERNDLHIWSADLDEPIDGVETLLTLDELDKASRFKFPVHRQRFIHGRGILRILLGHYLGKQPQEVQIGYGPSGKPMIESALSFNLAHSGQMAVYAFSFEGALGIDVERVHAIPEMSGVAKIFFSPQEYDEWKSLPASEQEVAFFNCWTRKEAFVKAVGVGISELLKEFVVSFAPGTDPELLHLDPKHGRKEFWKIISFEPAKGYLGAVAVANSEARPGSWRFQVSQSAAIASSNPATSGL
ncbi:MAG: 4'-phosphopantetheinyl transferase family protein [Verrucomicrobiales bacterium]